MMKAVVDTNVLLVADRQHSDVTPECVLACTDRLEALKQNGQVVIDDGYRIISEYQNKIDAVRGRGMGTAFLKWLLNNKSNPDRVEQVHITPVDEHRFAEFPDADLERVFDAPDRKFVAVANAHSAKPPIWQAADSKWLDWWSALQEHGIQVKFLCPDDVMRFYRKKFPDKEIPALP